MIAGDRRCWLDPFETPDRGTDQFERGKAILRQPNFALRSKRSAASCGAKVEEQFDEAEGGSVLDRRDA
jgi:hypothetical protein